MKSLCVICLTAFGVVTFSGCSAPAANNDAAVQKANAIAPTVAPPTVEALKALEATAFDAYKNKDTNFFQGFLTDRFVESANGRRLDKDAAIKMIAEHKCDIRAFSFSDEKLTNVGSATAIITMKVTADGACDGAKIPPFVSASIYVLDGIKWKGAWRGEVVVVDPKAPPAVRKSTEPERATGAPANRETRELAAIEKSVWEGWMNRDGKLLESLTARELAFVNIFGGYFTNRTDTLKNWTENPCEIRSVDVADASSVRVTDDTSILMHKGTASGTCFGQKVDPILGTSIYVKEGSAWKLAFTMNMPAS